jgi:cupin fold WbuC family metalloprotein
MKTRRLNDEVLFADEAVVSIGPREIVLVKELAEASERRRARLCLHRAESDPVHEMLIALRVDGYVRPHKHVGRGESFHVVEGAADVVLFDDVGRVVERVRMAAEGDGARIYRLNESRFHTVLVRTPVVVVHETTAGPFDRGDTVFASWAPAEGDAAAVAHYLADLNARLAE